QEWLEVGQDRATTHPALPDLDQRSADEEGGLTQLVFKDVPTDACVGLPSRVGKWIEHTRSVGAVDFSRGRSVIVLQHATKPLPTRDGAGVVPLLRERHDEPVAQALVIAFVMIVVRELTHGSPEGSFPEEDDPVQT